MTAVTGSVAIRPDSVTAAVIYIVHLLKLGLHPNALIVSVQSMLDQWLVGSSANERSTRIRFLRDDILGGVSFAKKTNSLCVDDATIEASLSSQTIDGLHLLVSALNEHLQQIENETALLRNCPFCGGRAVMLMKTDSVSPHEEQGHYWRVTCEVCLAGTVRMSGLEETCLAQLARLWNQRATEATSVEQVKSYDKGYVATRRHNDHNR